MANEGVSEVIILTRSCLSKTILLTVFFVPAMLVAASHDNDVEWYGVFSHPGFRSPMYPAKGQSFTVELRVYKGDITGARVRTWDGSEHFYATSWNRNEGSYDIYRSVKDRKSTRLNSSHSRASRMPSSA